MLLLYDIMRSTYFMINLKVPASNAEISVAIHVWKCSYVGQSSHTDTSSFIVTCLPSSQAAGNLLDLFPDMFPNK